MMIFSVVTFKEVVFVISILYSILYSVCLSRLVSPNNHNCNTIILSSNGERVYLSWHNVNEITIPVHV